jgi:hypothetical protein
MKPILLFLFLFCFQAIGQITNNKSTKSVKKFIAAVENHDTGKLTRQLDKEYCKNQKTFINNDSQFINELFSGEDLLTGKFTSPIFYEITKIEIAEIEEINANELIYTFRIRGVGFDILTTLLLKKIDKKYKFIGSEG